MGQTGIIWGGYAGSSNERVGVNISWDDYDTNTPSISVYIDWYVDSMYSIADNQVLNISGTLGGSASFHMTPGARLVLQQGIGGQGQNYNGGPTYNFTGTISGHYGGAQPSVSVNWALPARPANVPTQPGLSVTAITSSTAQVNVTAADGRGAGIDQYEQQISTNGAWTAIIRHWYGGSAAISGLSRATTHWVRTRAHNGVGWGDWNTTTFVTLPTKPDEMAAPVITNVTPDSVTFSRTAPNNGGSAITSYGGQVATNAGFTAGVIAFGSELTVDDLVPGTAYWIRVRAQNAYGVGDFSPSASFTTMAGIKVKVNGVWKNAKLWVKVANNWRPAKVWKKNNSGTWVI